MTTPFSELDKASQRVAIAQDVLQQIRQEVYTPTCGTYITVDTDVNEDNQLQDLLVNNTATCEVCGIGSLFTSLIKFTNHFTVREANEMDYESIGKTDLINYFPGKQLALIELAFEVEILGLSLIDEFKNDPLENSKAIVFGLNYAEEEDRLVAIMNNIIENNGTFVL